MASIWFQLQWHDNTKLAHGFPLLDVLASKWEDNNTLLDWEDKPIYMS